MCRQHCICYANQYLFVSLLMPFTCNDRKRLKTVGYLAFSVFHLNSSGNSYLKVSPLVLKVRRSVSLVLSGVYILGEKIAHSWNWSVYGILQGLGIGAAKCAPGRVQLNSVCHVKVRHGMIYSGTCQMFIVLRITSGNRCGFFDGSSVGIKILLAIVLLPGTNSVSNPPAPKDSLKTRT